jgi:hypothetical protein
MSYFDNWTQAPYGEVDNTIAGERVRVIPLLRGWLLECSSLSWFSEDKEGLQGMVEFLAGYNERKIARGRQASVRVTEDLGNGFSLLGQVASGSSFRIHLSLEGKKVGYYEGFLNTAISTFVLGQDAIQGAEWLDDCARGKGFGDKMRDLAERITGLPAVPHCRNFAPGGLSDAAAKSWDRRSKFKPVLGHGTDVGVKIRKAMVDKMIDRRAAFSHGTIDLLSAMALAEKTNLPLMVGFSRGDPSCAWVIGEGGVPLEPTGRINPDTLKRYGFDYAYADSPIKFKQMSFRKADATVDGDWRAEISDFHLQHVERMCNLLNSPRYNEFQNLVRRIPEPCTENAIGNSEVVQLPKR